MSAVNEIPKTDMSTSTTGCCPKFDPSGWDGQTFKFDKKLFVKFSSRSFLHMPLNMNSVMTRVMTAVREANATKDDEHLMLSDESSAWRTDHYLAVTKEVPGMEMARLSGTYLAKVFEGPYKEAASWYGEMVKYVESKGKKPIKIYFNYTTCPKCAKAYGKNYVVGFAQVD
jgi:hypothetical protein